MTIKQVAFLLPNVAAALLSAPPALPMVTRNVIMSAVQDNLDLDQDPRYYGGISASVKASMKAASELGSKAASVEVLPVEAADVIQLVDTIDPDDVKEAHELQLDRYQPASGSQRDASVVQYREASYFFGALLNERESSRPAEEHAPIESTVKQKIEKMCFLQRELEHVVTSGLASNARQRWLADKAAIEEQKRECQQAWTGLRARQEQMTDAFDQLAARGKKATPSSTALSVGTVWMKPSTILVKTSTKEQITLLEEHMALSKRQAQLDAQDEALMETALLLYQEERSSRERRAEILESQQELLTELKSLAEETSNFNGHAAFMSDGFAEGLSYK
eukprot:CAMPEP_0174720846 /NCGR_PEP_ID=MMETSP1094-20130205/34675_1 /TAXON_ID=156173 /ORGANISM="Chrysochromulina brevifilum, Strain UTEX LB 985" /LENGTH=335 /DNA_ID=CAMNT_0015921415 /DNA_START=17 /DNA_END=1024 /DNA_ORIENTATION=+